MKEQASRAVIVVALLFAFRMLGLFMLLPVFSLYAGQYGGSTPFLIGLALGIYGLSQALLQIPFGLLSDKIGRKAVIVLGLCIFVLGSLVAAFSTSIMGVIIGRLLQGMGAIGSTLLALLADSTQEKHRTKAMAVVGGTIGLSFGVSMVIGPMLATYGGLSAIFFTTAGLGMLGVAMLLIVGPKTTSHQRNKDVETVPALLSSVLRNPTLLRLDIGIFTQHAILTAMFTVLPFILVEHGGVIPAQQHLHVYLPIMALAFIAMVPVIIFAEKYKQTRAVFLLAITVTAITQFCLSFWHQSFAQIITLLILYFTAFNLLEALLPSLVSKAAPSGSKGTAMGVYSTSQFLGIFAGGALAGLLNTLHIESCTFGLCGLLATSWLLSTWHIQLQRKPLPEAGEVISEVTPS